MIIIEGADNTGKSTLIKQLLEADPSLRLLHRERFKPGMEGTIAQTHIQSMLPLDDSIMRHAHSLADRSFLSECIYGPIFRGRCRMTPAEHVTLYGLLRFYRATIVWCDVSDEVVLRTWADREQLYDRDPLQIIYAYRAFMATLPHDIPLVRYAWNVPGAPKQRRDILHHEITLAITLPPHQDML